MQSLCSNVPSNVVVAGNPAKIIRAMNTGKSP